MKVEFKKTDNNEKFYEVISNILSENENPLIQTIN